MAHPLDHAQLYRVLAETAPDAIVTIDERSVVLSVNAAAERIFGYAAAELIGQSLTMLMPDRMRAGHGAGMGRYLATGRRHIPWQGVRVPVRTKAGVEIPVEIAFGEFEADGQRIFSGFLRDISDRVAAEQAVAAARTDAERRAAEAEALADQLRTQAAELELQTDEAQALAEELEQTNEQLQHALADAEAATEDAARAQLAAEAAQRTAEAANRAKSEFLAVMSHELRTPLNAIQGHVQLLEMGLHGPITAAQRDALARVERAERHLLGLINDVLNYARLDGGRVEYDLRPVSVHDAVTDVVSMIGPQVASADLVLAVRPPESAAAPPVQVRADREKLAQVLLNLLSNAIKFTPAGGRITVDLEVDGDDAPGAGRVRLRVRDTGVGIAADQLERIFEPFVQVRADPARLVDGTGLGLAISRDLARGMGGELTVESVVGVGSTFTLALPRA